jgi:hypothetical protein
VTARFAAAAGEHHALLQGSLHLMATGPTVPEVGMRSVKSARK